MYRIILILLLGVFFKLSIFGQNSFPTWKCATCKQLETKKNVKKDSRQSTWKSDSDASLRFVKRQNQSVIIEHLIVVDQSAERYAQEHLGGVDAMAKLAIETINNAMRNSNVEARFRLADVLVLKKEFHSIDEGFDFILNSEDIRQKRRELKADIVTLCVQNIGDGTTGVAIQEAKRAKAYSTVMASAIPGYVVAHEVAHIFGCQHSRNEERADKGQHAYAVGAVCSPYYTIMGYSSDSQNAYELAPIYSGVNSVWKGVRLGSPIEDNVRMLRERMYEVSTFGDYLESKYYVDNTEHYVGDTLSVIQVDVKTSEFFQLQSDSPWLHPILSNGKTFSLDDVSLSIQVDANKSGHSRIGRITLSGTDFYDSVIITVHQGEDNPNAMIIAEKKNATPYLISSKEGVKLCGASAENVEIYTLRGERVLTFKQLEEDEKLINTLSSGVYLCRIIHSGRVSICKLKI